MSMDRLVELFLESARPESEASCAGPPFGGGAPDAEAIEKGVSTLEKLLSSEDAMQMGGSPLATFVCVGMALEEKPKLSGAAIRCYEKALEYLDRRALRGSSVGGWERGVVLQQIGAVCLRQGRYEEADRRLRECAEACKDAQGHPRDAVLFSGAFNTKQTKLEFAATVEKLRAKTCMHLGDRPRAEAHVLEAQRLEAATKGDAVERQAAQEQHVNGKSAASEGNGVAAEGPKELWAASPKEMRSLKEYQYTDEGPTVMVIVELNDHLGIGPEASEIVRALPQFRIRCELDTVDVQLRVRRRDGQLWHFQLLLQPLAREIIPEDTVPRLRGKEGKRRLEIKLFKRDKQITWYGDLVAEGAKRRPEPAPAARGGKVAPVAPPKGTLLNPLTPEELQRLPTPGGLGSGGNRPSGWQDRQASGRAADVEVERPAAETAKPSSETSRQNSHRQASGIAADVEVQQIERPAAEAAKPSSEPSRLPSGAALLPAWVASVEERDVDGFAEISVRLGEAAGPDVQSEDLQLDVDSTEGKLLLRLARAGPGSDAPLELHQLQGVDFDQLQPRWRKKTRVLELRFPRP